jgi:hypothetical protein
MRAPLWALCGALAVLALADPTVDSSEICTADGTCTGGEEAPCTNEHEQCEEWAKTGECKTNPDYMLKDCR